MPGLDDRAQEVRVLEGLAAFLQAADADSRTASDGLGRIGHTTNAYIGKPILHRVQVEITLTRDLYTSRQCRESLS